MADLGLPIRKRVSGRTVPFVLLVIVAVVGLTGMMGYALYSNRDESETAQRQLTDNRLLFKFACTLPLALAERLDQLVDEALKNTTLTRPQREVYRDYSNDFERNKGLCPSCGNSSTTSAANYPHLDRPLKH
jgi:ribosomal protein S27AE